MQNQGVSLLEGTLLKGHQKDNYSFFVFFWGGS